MTTTAITHASKPFLFGMLVPRMPSRIPSAKPGVHGVTIETIRSERSTMPSRVAVAGKAGGGRPRELTFLMAGGAVNANVSARQREVGFIVVEGRIIPTSGFVACPARQGEPSCMSVILFMAVGARADRIRLRRVLVALLTVHIQVLAIQFERGLVVVECGGSPRVHGVTRQTVRSEAAFVRFILPMAGETVPRGGLQI